MRLLPASLEALPCLARRGPSEAPRCILARMAHVQATLAHRTAMSDHQMIQAIHRRAKGRPLPESSPEVAAGVLAAGAEEGAVELRDPAGGQGEPVAARHAAGALGTPLAERAGDVKHSMASVEKLRAAGFQPGGNFDDGLRATIEFFVKRAPAR